MQEWTEPVTLCAADEDVARHAPACPTGDRVQGDEAARQTMRPVIERASMRL
jgi:hypothetical protein